MIPLYVKPFPDRCNCEDDNYVFTYSTDNPETIAPSGTVTITIDGGCPPYTWSVVGNSTGTWTLVDEDGEERLTTDADENFGDTWRTHKSSNILKASANARGSATITVTDGCGEQISKILKCTTGTWILRYSRLPTMCIENLYGMAFACDTDHYVDDAHIRQGYVPIYGTACCSYCCSDGTYTIITDTRKPNQLFYEFPSLHQCFPWYRQTCDEFYVGGTEIYYWE